MLGTVYTKMLAIVISLCDITGNLYFPLFSFSILSMGQHSCIIFVIYKKTIHPHFLEANKSMLSQIALQTFM